MRFVFVAINIAVPFVSVLAQLLVHLEKFILQVGLLSLVQIIHFVVAILRVEFDLLPWLEHVLFGSQNLLDLLELAIDFFLAVTSDSVTPIGGLSLPQTNRVDGVDGPCQEEEPRNVHVGELFEATRVPEVDRLVP